MEIWNGIKIRCALFMDNSVEVRMHGGSCVTECYHLIFYLLTKFGDKTTVRQECKFRIILDLMCTMYGIMAQTIQI